ncbi:MAG: stage III sporulation protein AG [Faecalibacterium sp.]
MSEGFSARWKALQSARGRARLAMVLGAAAMLLILLSEIWPQSRPAAEASAASGWEAEGYRSQLEQSLEELISQMEGAGRTKVMVTLETGEEMVYALDTQSGQTQSAQTHVLLEDGTALTQTVCLPRVCGVAVVCEGGGDVRVAARITELVSALLDLSSNRICVEQLSG